MLDQIFLIVAVTCLAMVTPGADMILVLCNTVTGGRLAGLQTALGVLTGNLVHITYCLLGIGWVISRSIVAFELLKYAGASYLIYLGVMSLRSSRKRLDADGIGQKTTSRSWWAQGFFNNLLNPKGALFYLGVFTTIITADTSSISMALLISFMMLVSASFWLCFVYTLDRPGIRGFVHRSQETVNRTFGLVLIALGIKVAMFDR